ncbi:L,D-transpeptidase [Salinactinospora qingdaonensis]|uniref:Ig-like domain-containing protein n=1 Tax=Salinactinospora qingdaonensis TaxID=702744 RepID=A0ABP7FY18_9ACTN
MRGRFKRTDARKAGAALAGVALLVAGCSSNDADNAEEAAVNQGPLQLVVAPEDGATDVAPDTPITVTATNGTITDVQVTQSARGEAQAGASAQASPAVQASPAAAASPDEATGADRMTGTLSTDKSEWVSDWTMAPGSNVTVAATAENSDGETREAVSTFATVRAEAGNRLEVASNFPQSGDTVGIGMPVIVNFDSPVTNKAAVEAAMEVTSEKPTEGAWNWFGDKMAVFRPKEYWEPLQRVWVDLHLAGVPGGEERYGIENHRIEFEVGRAQSAAIDNSTHQMVIERAGERIKEFPISMGDASEQRYTTTSGTHLMMNRHRDMVMDSASVGVPPGSPGYYRVDVEYAIRFSDSGEFTHAAPWNNQLGESNESHGCVNMSTEDAKWLYENTLKGDPLIIEGTDRELEVSNGWGYWQRSWQEWLEHSNLGKPDRTGEPGSPGAPHSLAE